MNDIHRRDLMNACHHEAGHLVALTLLGGDGFMEVYPTHTRNLKKEAAFTGKTRLVKSTTHPADMKIVALAGVVAETVLHEPEVQGFEILESLMYESLLLSPSDADIAGEYTEEDVEAALCLVRENWQRVVVLAEAEAAKFSGGALQTQKSPVGAGPICKAENSHRDHIKQQPPFANRVRLFGANRSIRLFFGGHAAWDRAKDDIAKGYPALLLPLGERPKGLDWRCVRGRSIVAIELDDTGPGFRVTLVRLLAAHGAREVVLNPFDRNPANAVFWGV